MMEGMEFFGKTVEEATNEALAKLGVTIDEIDIEVVESGSKGILGIGSKPAKIIVKKPFSPESAARQFLDKFFEEMGMPVKVHTEVVTEKILNITLEGEKMGILIGKRGQTLDALQYLVTIIINKGQGPYVSVNLDTEEYRKRRRETLESLALNLAKKAKSIRRNVVLEPMSPYERRVIHSVLQGDKNIATYSEGHEPYRHVVISPR